MKPIYLDSGFFAHRTRCMDYDRAQSFALCLKANNTRFTNVTVDLSDKAKGDRAWFVVFQPANPLRMADIAELEQASRIRRADVEGGDYIFVADHDAPRSFFRCFNPASGNVYELDHSSCDCPDFTYRLAKVPGFGVRCKHLIELDRRVAAGELLRLSEARAQAHPSTYGIREYHPAEVATMAATA